MAEDLTSSVKFQCSVSSVLNKDHKMYGKQNLFDGTEETCWNSEQGKNQWIQIKFAEPVKVSQISIMFQGGFVGKDCFIHQLEGKTSVESVPFYPSDINYLQNFDVNLSGTTFKIEFKDSTDFFGRITIYQLSINGNKI